MPLSSSLSGLRSFRDAPQPAPEAFGAALRDPRVREVVLHCEDATEEGARLYARIQGISGKMRRVLVKDGLPGDAALSADAPGVVPLFVDSAVNPDLNRRFFRRPEAIAFADYSYVPSPGHASPELQVVGTTPNGLETVAPIAAGLDARSLARLRDERSHRLLGGMITPEEVRTILRSTSARIRLHALGPSGTNIERAAKEYIDALGIRDKADVVVHGRGVEPMRYAEIAAAEAADGIIPLHMECAVYYDMARLYRERVRELVFADHHYMKLDAMQLAADPDRLEDVLSLQTAVIASHPSPRNLVDALTETGAGDYLKASSNAAAADMVLGGEADLCITTEEARRQRGLRELHRFGSPPMVFTVATPYDADRLRQFA